MMSLFAALAAALGAALPVCVQSTVAIYGRLDLSLTKQNAGAGATPPACASAAQSGA